MVSAQISNEMKAGIERYVEENPEMSKSAVVRTGIRKVLSEQAETTDETVTNE